VSTQAIAGVGSSEEPRQAHVAFRSNPSGSSAAPHLFFEPVALLLGWAVDVRV
jgi:hypothetical protein